MRRRPDDPTRLDTSRPPHFSSFSALSSSFNAKIGLIQSHLVVIRYTNFRDRPSQRWFWGFENVGSVTTTFWVQNGSKWPKSAKMAENDRKMAKNRHFVGCIVGGQNGAETPYLMSMRVSEVIQACLRSIYAHNTSWVSAGGSYKSTKVACAGRKMRRNGKKDGSKMSKNRTFRRGPKSLEKAKSGKFEGI